MTRVLLFVALLLLALGVPAGAQSMEDEVRRIGGKLQCPVCEGQTVADSNSGLARDMRTHIRQQLEAGRGEQEILQAFVVSYGEGILTEPPKSGASLVIWVVPPLVLLAGGLMMVALLRGWRRRPAPNVPASVAQQPLSGAALDEFSRFKAEVGG